MSDPETSNQPLLAAPSQQAVMNAQGGRSSRAYKIAGLTLLACVLIVGQATIAYFLISQRNDIRSLKDQNNDMNSELTKGRSVAVPMRMHLPMKVLSNLKDFSEDKDSTGTPGETVPVKATDCQLEAAGVKPVQVPDFRPACDERGLYRAQQCFMESCWCVNPITGQEIPESLTRGQRSCDARVYTGGLRKIRTHDIIN